MLDLGWTLSTMSIILTRGRGRSETQRYNGEPCEGEVRGCSDISVRYCQQPPEAKRKAWK